MTKPEPLPVVIEALLPEDPDIDAINAIGESSFSTSTRMDAREEICRPFTHAWVARLPSRAGRGQPVGYIVTWHVADELHVLNVATSAQHRRRGVGLALMQSALSYAHERQIRLIVLEVRLGNHPAVQMYRSMGFFAIGLRPGYYADNGEDALEMVLVFDPETGRVVPGRDEVRI
jgi:[ribosomal protein S18]-alanine N-acetyltransferase